MSEPSKQDAVATLGTILERDEGRDAVHVAVVAAVAGMPLNPGQHVSIAEGVAGAYLASNIGIVDPFLPAFVGKGQRFWLFLYPRTITGLRHVWTHPAFPEEGEVSAAPAPAPALPPAADPAGTSRAWLEALALGLGMNYAELVGIAQRYLASEGYWDPDDLSCFSGREFPDEFWGHYERATGTVVEPKDRGNFFRCSC